MQLSAPTLPIDPGASRSADATGFPPTGGNADTDSSSRSDFGAMLSAESHGNHRSPSAARSNPRGAIKEARGTVDDHRETHEFSGRGRSASSARRSQTTAASPTIPEALAAAVGQTVAATLATPPQDPAVPEIDLTFNLQPSVPGSEDANTSADLISSDESSTAAGQIVPGRAFSGDMPAGSSRAGIHAYGLRGDMPATARSNTVAATAVAATSVANLGIVPTLPSDEAVELSSTSSTPNLTEAATTPIPEASAPIAQGAVTLGNKSAGAQITNGGVIERIAEENREVSAAVVADEQSMPDALVELGNPQSSAANLSKDGSTKDAEVIAPAATAGVAEKIAAQLSRSADRLTETTKSKQRLSLDADTKVFEAAYDRFGINVAKFETHMPAHASTSTPAPVAIEHASVAAMPLSFANLVKEGGEGPAGQMAQLARRAVESALAVADQYATGDQRSVKLQFTVGGEELAVRVELKGNQVHTTFRTDSPELRSALAQEWQSVSAAQTGVRPHRLADPVFASNSSTGQGMSSDSGAAHQRDSGARHPQTAPEEIFGTRHTFSTTAAAPAVSVAAPVTTHRADSSVRLHTFA